MSGRNDGLRRKRTKYKRSSAFNKTKRDPFDFKTDYSAEESWQRCIERIAIAQSTIGIKDAMLCVESVVPNREYRKEGYVYCSPSQLEEALKRMRTVYLRKKK